MTTVLENDCAGLVSAGPSPGLYLTFALGKETYGLEILKVQEIIGLMPITKVPRTPDYVRGVINLRGRVIPVVDLRGKFGLEPHDDTSRTCIIVLQVEGESGSVTTGITVDEVNEVLDIASSQLEPPPALGTGGETEFIQGMGKVGDKVIILLDSDRALGDIELN